MTLSSERLQALFDHPLQRVSFVHFALGLHISRVGKLRSGKASETDVLSVDRYPCSKSSFLKIDTKKPGGLIAARCASIVLQIDRRGNVSKIGDPVVGLASVDMVNLLRRVFAIKVKPCKAMREQALSKKANLPIASMVQATGDHSLLNVARRICFPPKNSGKRIVIEGGAKNVCGNMPSSHAASLIGRVVRALATFPRCRGSFIVARDLQ
jgi:hypothetical protein